MAKKVRWLFDVDIVGRCNLRCPSCPVGNSTEVPRPSGYMQPSMLRDIVTKAKAECNVVAFSLYNWTEPFLHPYLPEMVAVVKSRGIACNLSSNFMLGKQIERVVEANPDIIKVSVSGFFQETYGVTHKGGDIETVKKNMTRLAEAIAKSDSTTRVVVPFHRYLGNHRDEVEMLRFTESLGFELDPAWAYLMPLEKALGYAGDEDYGAALTDQDRRLVGRLALPLDRALEVCSPHKEMPCRLRDRQMALTSEGKVMLCCTVFDQRRFAIAPFLTTPFEELQRLKNSHALCGVCQDKGLHVLFTYGTEELDTISVENVLRHYPDQNIEEIYHETKRRRSKKARTGLSRVRLATRPLRRKISAWVGGARTP